MQTVTITPQHERWYDSDVSDEGCGSTPPKVRGLCNCQCQAGIDNLHATFGPQLATLEAEHTRLKGALHECPNLEKPILHNHTLESLNRLHESLVLEISRIRKDNQDQESHWRAEIDKLQRMIATERTK
jgi:hypothetical protein